MDFRTHILPHRDRLYRLALSMALQPADAEDVVQDTMLRAWERKAEWTQIANMQAWLIQICKHLVLDRKKRADAQMQPLVDTGGLTSASGSAATSGPNPQTQLEASESMALLTRLISELPPPQPELVRLRDIEGLSYQDIAQQTGLTDAQVRVYLHRARAALQERYQRLYKQ